MHKIISKNSIATFDFQVERTLEVGVELRGWEVKSLRMYGVSLKNSFCSISNGEAWWKGVSIKSPLGDNDSKRHRKLLMHKKQIYKFYGEMSHRPLTLIPLECYFKNKRYFKLLIGLCSKSSKFDKREKIKQRDTEKIRRQEGEF
jgi:SsrA-binding protein